MNESVKERVEEIYLKLLSPSLSYISLFSVAFLRVAYPVTYLSQYSLLQSSREMEETTKTVERRNETPKWRKKEKKRTPCSLRFLHPPKEPVAGLAIQIEAKVTPRRLHETYG